MLSLALPDGLASALNAEEVEQAVGVTTHCGGITYPAGGWLCPAQLTRAVLALATEQGLQTRFRYTLTSLVTQESHWQLHFASGETASHDTVVLANGHQINRFDQTRSLPVYAVSGQVSHIPTTPALSALRQVLCYDGYLTPQNPHNHQHCIGASYHRGTKAPSGVQKINTKTDSVCLIVFRMLTGPKRLTSAITAPAAACAAPLAIICRWWGMSRITRLR